MHPKPSARPLGSTCSTASKPTRTTRNAVDNTLAARSTTRCKGRERPKRRGRPFEPGPSAPEKGWSTTRERSPAPEKGWSASFGGSATRSRARSTSLRAAKLHFARPKLAPSVLSPTGGSVGLVARRGGEAAFRRSQAGQRRVCFSSRRNASSSPSLIASRRSRSAGASVRPSSSHRSSTATRNPSCRPSCRPSR